MNLIQPMMMIFSIVFLGIFFEKRKIFTLQHVEALQKFLLNVGLPCYLFTSILHHDLKSLIHWPYVYSYLLSFAGVAGYIMIVFPKSRGSKRSVQMLAAGYSNTSMYSLPVITLLLGDPSASIMAMLIQIIGVQSVFLTFLSFEKHKEKSIADKLLAGVSTPLIIMPILGLLCNALDVHLYPVLTSTIEHLGQGVSSLTLFVFGLTVGSIRLHKDTLDKPLVLMAMGKTMVHPIIGFCVGRYVFDLAPYWLWSLVIATCAPTAFIIYLISKQFGIDQERIKKVVALTSVLSLVSLVILGCMIKSQ